MSVLVSPHPRGHIRGRTLKTRTINYHKLQCNEAQWDFLEWILSTGAHCNVYWWCCIIFAATAAMIV